MTETESNFTRRKALGTVAAVAATAATGAAVAACSGSTGSSGSTGTTPSSTAAAGTVLGPVADITEGGGKIFADQKVVVTSPAAGQYKGFSSTCTHQGCQVGKVENSLITCTCHGSQFNITDGSVKTGPASTPLPAVAVSVKDGQIVLGA